MSLQEFRDLLLGITEKAYHFEAAQDAPDKYIVWQETGSRASAGIRLQAGGHP